MVIVKSGNDTNVREIMFLQPRVDYRNYIIRSPIRIIERIAVFIFIFFFLLLLFFFFFLLSVKVYIY